MSESAHVARQAIEAVWRIESARLLGGLVRMVRDVGLAEDIAQETLITALERWPESGIPQNPGAWLMTSAKHRAIDKLRRQRMTERNHDALEAASQNAVWLPDFETAADEVVDDDLLRLVFIACHPVLSAEARVALTLRLLGGLTTEEIARAFLAPEPTITGCGSSFVRRPCGWAESSRSSCRTKRRRTASSP